MYRGTMGRMNSGAKRWSAPKTTSGMAKHRLLKATIFSRPRALATSFFEAMAATKKTAMPVEHMAAAVREIANKAAKMARCMGLPFQYINTKVEILLRKHLRNGVFRRVGLV